MILIALMLILTACVPQYQRVAQREFTGACTVDAVTIRSPSVRSQILTSAPHPRGADLQSACEPYAVYAGVNLALHVVADDTPVPYYGMTQGPAPWTDWRSPRMPVDIYVREMHLDDIAADDQRPSHNALRHEATHAKLWRATGDPDAAHTSPLWEGVIAGWRSQ